MRKYISGLFIASALLFSGCYYDVESELYPAPTCENMDVNYTTHIEPIISANCDNCHAGTAVDGGNIILEGYTNLKNFDSNRLYGAVSHTSGSQMPKGANKLSDCDIAIIKKWIDTGKPQ